VIDFATTQSKAEHIMKISQKIHSSIFSILYLLLQ